MSAQVRRVAIDDITPHPNNPKAHDLGTLTDSIVRFGFVEPIVVDQRSGLNISGHGRVEALSLMRDRGDDPPEGVTVDKQGRWLAPVFVGWSSANDTEADAALVALNRIGETGGWQDGALAELLGRLEAVDGGFDGVGFDSHDLDDLRHTLANLDEETEEEQSRWKGVTPSVRTHPIDLIFSWNGVGIEAQLARRVGWKMGLITSGQRHLPLEKIRSVFPKYPPPTFMDNEWHDYDHAAHIEVLSYFHPKYATVRDAVTREQAADAGVEFYPLSQVLEFAAEAAEVCENVIVIPKYDCLDDIPEQYVLGYSVPSSYGGTPLPPSMFAGRRVHLLGGSWKAQRSIMAQLGDDVVSLDNNHLCMAARYGRVILGDGRNESLPNLHPDLPGSDAYLGAIAISLANIAIEVRRIAGGAEADETFDPYADDVAPVVDRDGTALADVTLDE